MTETTARIRWERNEDDNSLTGRTGTMTDPVFWIWPPESPGKAHILTSSLPGHDKDFYPDGFVSDVKAKAEEWLAEHVSSLGAVFPEPGRVAAALAEIRERNAKAALGISSDLGTYIDSANDVPRLLKAVEAALTFHVEAVIEDMPDPRFRYCRTCSGHPAWPCPKVAAIIAELAGAQLGEDGDHDRPA